MHAPGTLTLNHMTVTKLWHFDAPSAVDVNVDLVSASPDPATRTILRVGNIANNARLSRAHANSPATASSAAIMSSTLGRDPNAVSAKSRWLASRQMLLSWTFWMLSARTMFAIESDHEVRKRRLALNGNGWE